MWNFLKRSRYPGKPNLAASAPRGNFVREFVSDGYVVQVDQSKQTLKLHAENDVVWQRTPLNPTFASVKRGMSSERFVSASSMLAFEAKQFDDGPYAAVTLPHSGARVSIRQDLTSQRAGPGPGSWPFAGRNEPGGICCRSAGRRNSRTTQHDGISCGGQIERFIRNAAR